MAFEVQRIEQDGRARVVVRGELDMTNGDRLERELLAAEATGVGVVELDLSSVDYFDSTGLGLVLDADLRAAQSGRKLLVLAGDGEAARVLRMVNVRDRLSVAELE
jgi:anti-anti-sigma factor